MSTPELSYAAGLYEGEGTVYVCRASGRDDRAVVQVKMTDREPLERMQEATGLGRINGPYSRPDKAWKPWWQWTINRQTDVPVFRAQVYDMLSPRRQAQFDRALAEVST